jgi:adenine deaminase
VENGAVLPSIEQDVLPICCVERYGKNGNIGRGFIHGFDLKQGAIAGSVAHDHHNIVVVGVDPHDMRLAVEALVESQGGFVVVSDRVVLSLLPLPLCGLMSEEKTETVAEKLASVRSAARSLGSPITDWWTSSRTRSQVYSWAEGPCWTTFELPPLGFKPWTQKFLLRSSILERA